MTAMSFSEPKENQFGARKMTRRVLESSHACFVQTHRLKGSAEMN